MEGLRLELQSCPGIELGIASASDVHYEVFEEDRTKFYNIHTPAKNGSLASIYRRWFPIVEPANELKACLTIIEQFKPDVIHVHGSEGYFGTLAKKTSIPMVISIQGILTICELFYYGGLSIMERIEDISSVGFLRGIGTFHQHRYTKKMALREIQILKICRHFIGRTEFDKNFIGLINPNSVYYHCDEILRSPFYYGKWTPRETDKLIIYCTTGSVPYKGLDCLLDACHILKSNGITEIELRVAGPIQNSPTWHILQGKVRNLHLADDVTWLGICSAEIIVSELEKASLFVLPSYIENSPNSLAEAMLVGTPCVASSVGGVPSLVTHNKDGLLFPRGDAYSLAGMIAKLQREPGLARSISENARKIAHVRHDPQKIAGTMINIYNAIKNHSPSENNEYPSQKFDQ